MKIGKKGVRRGESIKMNARWKGWSKEKKEGSWSVGCMRDSLPGPEHIEGSRWKSGTVN